MWIRSCDWPSLFALAHTVTLFVFLKEKSAVFLFDLFGMCRSNTSEQHFAGESPTSGQRLWFIYPDVQPRYQHLEWSLKSQANRWHWCLWSKTKWNKNTRKVGLQGHPTGEEHPGRCGYPLLLFFFCRGSEMRPLNLVDCCSWTMAKSNTARKEKHPLCDHCENWHHRHAVQTSSSVPGPAMADTHQTACSRRTAPPPRRQSRLDGNKNNMEMKLQRAEHNT